jgi:alkanesulfonate monooxygenase SsuD/methylene tetrahydromethanopterin reductase-like flavin-dependent oxidoreductase (luciferase family)
VGRLADGWLGSLLTPAEAGAAVAMIQAAAADAGRVVDPDHFGLSVPVALDGIPDELLASIRHRRPDTDPAALIPVGWDATRRLIEQYVEAGLSKFVVRPAAGSAPAGSAPAAPGSFAAFLDGFVRELMPMQT